TLSPRHCERSEAIHPSAGRDVDCFAALAMTWIGLKSIPRDDFALVAMDGLAVGEIAEPAARQKLRPAATDRAMAAASDGRFAVVGFAQQRQCEDVAPHLPGGGDFLVIGADAQWNVQGRVAMR